MRSETIDLKVSLEDEGDLHMLQTFIYYNVDRNGQDACTRTAYAVDDLLQDVTREQLVSVQTQVYNTEFETFGYTHCVTTVVIDVPEKD